ncbi:hypothetical protein IAU59_007390 [Kwoniella sp. CBS 9459]
MSRAAIASLESQLSTATHELELATFLNKGILQTNTEYKLRIAELESENVILQKAESRLSKTEDKLEEVEKRLRAILAEKGDWQVARTRDLQERDKILQDRDEWEARYRALRQRLDDILSDEETQKTVLAKVPGTKQRQLASLVNPDHRANAKTSVSLSSKGANIRTPTSTSAVRLTPASSNGSFLSRQATQAQLPAQPVASSSRLSISPIVRPARAQSKKRRRVQDSSSDEDDIGTSSGRDVQLREEEGDNGDGAGPQARRSRSHLFHRKARDQKIVLDGADDHLDFDLDFDDVMDGAGDQDGRMQSDPLGGSQLYNLTPPKNRSPSRNVDRDREHRQSNLSSNTASIPNTAQKQKQRPTASHTNSHKTPSGKNKQNKRPDASSASDIDVKPEPISVSPEDRTKPRVSGSGSAKKGQLKRRTSDGRKSVVKARAGSGRSESDDDPLAMV